METLNYHPQFFLHLSASYIAGHCISDNVKCHVFEFFLNDQKKIANLLVLYLFTSFTTDLMTQLMN